MNESADGSAQQGSAERHGQNKFLSGNHLFSFSFLAQVLIIENLIAVVPARQRVAIRVPHTPCFDALRGKNFAPLVFLKFKGRRA